MIKFLIIISLFIFSKFALCAVNSDVFIIHAKFDKFTVLSPKKINKTMSIVIHNDTLVKFYARLESKNKKYIRYISIPPQKYKSIDLKNYNGKKYFFYPISPPFQKVVLDIGRRYYEIPEKK